MDVAAYKLASFLLFQFLESQFLFHRFETGMKITRVTRLLAWTSVGQRGEGRPSFHFTIEIQVSKTQNGLGKSFWYCSGMDDFQPLLKNSH